jgi:CMP/dCMP kinase
VSTREDLHRVVRDLGLQIAIDGPAGAGKSTVGRNLASALGCPYLDTGLMYRAVALRALEQGVPVSDGEALAALASEIRFELDRDPSGGLLIDGEPPVSALHSPAVDEIVSEVSAHAPVRRALLGAQRELADEDCIVMMGRDIGTTVLPSAPVKFWITASPEARASRRRTQRQSQSDGLAGDEMLGRITRRDSWDAGREASPLRKAPDAVTIDTGSRSPRETLERALDSVKAVLSSSPGKPIRRPSRRATPSE